MDEMTRIDYERDRIEAGRLPEPRQMDDGRPLGGESWGWAIVACAVVVAVVLVAMAAGMVIR